MGHSTSIREEKDGTLRYAIDYRKLNQSLLHDGMPLPNIPETLESLSKSSRYSCWNACAGFWVIRVRPKDRKYLAFHARFQGAWQLFTWLRMPFGVKSATACFQRMMSNVMGRGVCIRGNDSFVEDNEHSDECHDGAVSLINSICKVFVDDGVTHSARDEDHIDDLARTFKRLVANKISLKTAKCVWGTDELPLLGYLVRAGKGIAADPGKVKALLQADTPKLSSELHTFIGQIEYQRKFIPCLAEYLAPLRAIAKNCPYKMTIDITEMWTPEAQAAFDTLKVALAQDTVLRFPDFDQPFIIIVDTSRKKGVGAVLCQLDEDDIERPIEYASTNITDRQREMGISHLEGFGVCWAVKKWRRFLFGSVGVVTTDHSCLRSLVNPDKEFEDARMAKMALELSEHDLVIAHRAGARKDFAPADFMSRADVADADKVEQLMGRTFQDQASIAMKLNEDLRKQCLNPGMQ